MQNTLGSLLLALILVTSTSACGLISNPGPADETVVAQVRQYLDGLNCPGAGWRFSELFRITNITVKDRLVQGEKATIICQLTGVVIAKLPLGGTFGQGSTVSNCYAVLTKHRGAKEKEVLVAESRFEFQNFQNGWRLTAVE